MKSYQLIYSVSFKNSLIQLISEWENELFLSEEKIKHFVQLIYRSLELLRLFPKMHEDVSPLYGFDIPTYRILIGQSYAIFYRIDEENYSVLIGKIFKQKQMHLKF